MRKQECFDYSRRAVLGASGALAFLGALRPLRIFAQASGGRLRIGIIGSGHIGGAIGGLWVKAGHRVLFSSRHPEELKDLVAGLGPLTQNGTVSQAVAFGDALFFVVPYVALPQLGRDYGGALQGKIVLDACNAVPARRSHRRRGGARRCWDHVAEISARNTSGARVQHAFLYDLRTRGQPL